MSGMFMNILEQSFTQYIVLYRFIYDPLSICDWMYIHEHLFFQLLCQTDDLFCLLLHSPAKVLYSFQYFMYVQSWMFCTLNSLWCLFSLPSRYMVKKQMDSKPLLHAQKAISSKQKTFGKLKFCVVGNCDIVYILYKRSLLY